MVRSNVHIHLLAASIFSLAGAVMYFAYQASLISAQIPVILSDVKSTAEKAGPVVNEIAGIREQIPAILEEVAEVRKLVPPILAEAARTRETIPSIVDEMAATREAIPPILQESEQLRTQIPGVLKSVNNLTWATVQATNQMESYRPLAPEVIREIARAREAIDPTLDRVEAMIERARSTGRKASEGAVTGIFSGILAAPFRILGGIGTSLAGLTQEEAKHFSEEELAEYSKMGSALLETGKQGESIEWESNTSNARGKFTIEKTYTKRGRKCKVILAQAWKGVKRVVDKSFDVCLNESSEWEIQGTKPDQQAP